MVRRRTKGEIFIAGFAMFSFSSYFLISELPREYFVIFIVGAIVLFSAELVIKGRKSFDKIAAFLILLVLGILLVYDSAMEFFSLMLQSEFNTVMGLIYLLGWVLMALAGGIIKLSKII